MSEIYTIKPYDRIISFSKMGCPGSTKDWEKEK